MTFESELFKSLCLNCRNLQFFILQDSVKLKKLEDYLDDYINKKGIFNNNKKLASCLANIRTNTNFVCKNCSSYETMRRSAQ